MSAGILTTITPELDSFASRYRPLFGRPELQAHSGRYLSGLLGPSKRKSIEPMALDQDQSIRGLQRFASRGSWMDQAVLAEHHRHVSETLGEESGILVLDSRGFPKQGRYSVGVARQYCGHVGKIENCQVGVFLGYAASRGHVLLNHRLYLPQEWENDINRRNRCYVPGFVHHKPSGELSLEMIQEVRSNGLPFEWVTGDEEFGKSTPLADHLAAMGRAYIFEVPISMWVWTEPPRLKRASQRSTGGSPHNQPVLLNGTSGHQSVKAAAEKMKGRWERIQIRQGSKGPIEIEAKRQVVWLTRHERPHRPAWLVVTRTLGPKPVTKYFLAEGHWHVSLLQWLKVAYSRWTIEDCFEQTGQQCGMGQYEVRSWTGWNHHMTMVLLAQHFLAAGRIRRKKKDAWDDGGANRLLSADPAATPAN